jgi:hypothetical protein
VNSPRNVLLALAVLVACVAGCVDRGISWNFVPVAREAAADGRADGTTADAPIQPDHGSANA